MTRFIVATFALLFGFGIAAQAGDILAPGYKVEQLVKPSAFHGVHGLAFDSDGKLYAGSVVGESIYRVDVLTGKTEVVVGSPEGMADDLVFLQDGTLVWTSINQSVVRARKGNGPIRIIADKMPGANSVNVRKSDGRVFMGQVFAGDGLWELDPNGVKPPRSILKNIGGLNGFDIGPDGWIYGPLWFKKQVVKINPDTGELKVIATGFDTPAAANFDSKWNLFVLDTALGTVNQVDIKSGAKKVVATLATSLDNLAIDSKDRLFVSNMADNGIQEVDVTTGRARSVIKGSLAIPVSIAAVADESHDLIYVADIFALRAVNGTTGRVVDIERSHAKGAHIEYPVNVSANERHIYVAMSTGVVMQFAKSGSFQRELPDVRASNVVELNDGTLLAIQGNAIKRIKTNGEAKSIAVELEGLQGMAAIKDNVYVTDQAKGRLINVNFNTGEQKILAKDLQQPLSPAIDRNGRVLVIEFGKRRLISLDPVKGDIKELATNLPIGLRGKEKTDLGVGLTVGPSGAIYIASDIENSLYKLTPK